jgi:hypothetical protein
LGWTLWTRVGRRCGSPFTLDDKRRIPFTLSSLGALPALPQTTQAAQNPSSTFSLFSPVALLLEAWLLIPLFILEFIRHRFHKVLRADLVYLFVMSLGHLGFLG